MLILVSMTESLLRADRDVAESERISRLLSEFKPHSLQVYDKPVSAEYIEKIASDIKSDPDLTDEDREALLRELTARYDRTSTLSPYSHMGD